MVLRGARGVTEVTPAFCPRVPRGFRAAGRSGALSWARSGEQVEGGRCQRTAGGLGGAGWTDPKGRGAIALLPVGEGWRPHGGGGLRRCPRAVGDYTNAVRARLVPQNGRAAHRGVVRVPLYPVRFRAPRNRSCHEALTPQPGADRVSVRPSLRLSTEFGWGPVIGRLPLKGDPPGQVHTCHPHLWLAPAFEVLFVLACFEGWLVAAGSGGGGGRTGEHDAAPALFGPSGGSEATRQGHGEAVSAGMTFPPPTCEGRSESACVVPSTDRSWRLAVAPADRRRVTAETHERSPGTSPAVGWSRRDQLRLASPCSPAQSWRPLPAAQPTCWTSGRVGLL